MSRELYIHVSFCTYNVSRNEANSSREVVGKAMGILWYDCISYLFRQITSAEEGGAAEGGCGTEEAAAFFLLFVVEDDAEGSGSKVGDSAAAGFLFFLPIAHW